MRTVTEKRVNKAREEVQYVSFMCNNYSRSGKSACTIHSVSERRLKKLVFEDIQRLVKLAREDEDGFVCRIMDNETGQAREQGKVIEHRLHGLVPEEMFQRMINKYNAKFKAYTQDQEILKAQLLDFSEMHGRVLAWVENLKACGNFQTLNRKHLFQLIHHIDISEVKGATKAVNIRYQVGIPKQSP